MKTKNFIALAAVFAVAAAVAGCGRLETYGERISNRSVTPIKEILMHPKDYDGKTVTVKGKIAIECSTGCWFDLKEGGAVLYVDLTPGGFAIPQNVGRGATVEGKISIRDGKPILSGKGAEIR